MEGCTCRRRRSQTLTDSLMSAFLNVMASSHFIATFFSLDLCVNCAPWQWCLASNQDHKRKYALERDEDCRSSTSRIKVLTHTKYSLKHHFQMTRRLRPKSVAAVPRVDALGHARMRGGLCVHLRVRDRAQSPTYWRCDVSSKSTWAPRIHKNCIRRSLESSRACQQEIQSHRK